MLSNLAPCPGRHPNLTDNKLLVQLQYRGKEPTVPTGKLVCLQLGRLIIGVAVTLGEVSCLR